MTESGKSAWVLSRIISLLNLPKAGQISTPCLQASYRSLSSTLPILLTPIPQETNILDAVPSYTGSESLNLPYIEFYRLEHSITPRTLCSSFLRTPEGPTPYDTLPGNQEHNRGYPLGHFPSSNLSHPLSHFPSLWPVPLQPNPESTGGSVIPNPWIMASDPPSEAISSLDHAPLTTLDGISPSGSEFSLGAAAQTETSENKR